MILTTMLALAADPIDIAQPETLVEAMQEAGFRAELDTDDAGDPMIISSANGSTFVLLFYGCTANKNCEDLQFYAGYTLENDKPTLDDINQFNRQYRYTRAYIDQEGDPVVEMDIVDNDGKIDAAQFEHALEIWTGLMGTYQSHIGF